jgi:hypothetical protein
MRLDTTKAFAIERNECALFFLPFVLGHLDLLVISRQFARAVLSEGMTER